jgi:peptide/nickel transport system permease protein
LFRHILPLTASPLAVVGAFELAKVVIYEASLGFLGLGIQPPTPTLGNMMAAGRNYMDSAWWLTFFPGLLVVLTAAAANWTGDGLNELLDPRSKRI